MVPMDFTKDIKRNDSVLVVAPEASYESALIGGIRGVKGKICYISMSRTRKSLLEAFEREKIDSGRIFFIDCISKAIMFMSFQAERIPDRSENAIFLSYPGNLQGIEDALDDPAAKGFDYLVLDSLSSMTIYNKPDVVLKSLSSLLSKAKAKKAKAIVFSVAKKEQSDFMRKAAGLVGKAIFL
jgi:hypothetical protein